MKASGSNFTAYPSGVVGGSTTKNWGGAFSAWGDFNAVQLIFRNHTNVPATIDNHMVGVTKTGWPGGTFNLNAPTEGWLPPAGPVIVPPGVGSTEIEWKHQPGILVGPKHPARSVPRAAGEPDNGKYPLICHRTVTLAGNKTACYGTLNPGEGLSFPELYDRVNEGISILTTAPQYGDDYVSTPAKVAAWNFGGEREKTPGIIVFGAIFHYDEKFTSVMGVGDSTMEGDGDGGSKRAPYLFKATARIRAAGKKVCYTNAGISGSPMKRINVHGKALIAAGSAPDIMVLHSYTVNSPTATQADWDAQWFLVMDLAQAQLDTGGQVLLVTPLPSAPMDSAKNVFRLRQRQRVINSRLPYVDVEPLADPITGRWQNPALAPDQTHAAELGNEALASFTQPALDRMIP